MLSKKELTKAVQQYARKHNHYASTVRTISVLLKNAIKEYKNARITL